MPDDRYFYKIPAGTYRVITTWEKLTSISVVKDEIGHDSDSAPYSEYLQHVEDYQLTAGDDDFNGNAQKEAIITVGEDESVWIAYTKDSVKTPGSIKFLLYLQD